MGIRFNTNTWRAPLLLIDSWLPPAPERAAMPRPLSRSLQRFSRAGWMGRHAATDPVVPTTVQPLDRTNTRSPCRVRLDSSGDSVLPGAPTARVVISGRIDDVCDELARLADLELHAMSARC
jgi:hypothetical protein